MSAGKFFFARTTLYHRNKKRSDQGKNVPYNSKFLNFLNRSNRIDLIDKVKLENFVIIYIRTKLFIGVLFVEFYSLMYHNKNLLFLMIFFSNFKVFRLLIFVVSCGICISKDGK